MNTPHSLQVDMDSVPNRLRLCNVKERRLLLLRLLPYYLKHYLLQPYRRDIPSIGYRVPRALIKRRRRLTALYDSMYNLLLAGYCEIVGQDVTHTTGEMLFLLIELTRRIDEHLDNTVGTATSLARAEVLGAPLIREQMNVFSRYVEQFGPGKEVMSYLADLFANHFDNYVETLRAAYRSRDFQTILRAAETDTGVWLESVMKVVAIFNHHEPTDDQMHNFYLFGMVGKFADDMLDLPRDLDKDESNLLAALAASNPMESQILQIALEQHRRLRCSWWNAFCPFTYAAYFAYVEEYYSQIRSPKLRLACDLLMLPAMVGRDYDPERSRAGLVLDEDVSWPE